jgi:hypothetical protein
MNLQQRLSLEIAGLSAELQYEEDYPAIAYRRGGEFVADRAKADPDLPIRLALVDRLESPSPKSLVFESSTWSSAFASEDGYCFTWRSEIKKNAIFQKLHLRTDSGPGLLELSRDTVNGKKTCYPLEYPLDQMLFIHMLGRSGGALIHGGGVKHRGCGYLFVGLSGSGKTTLCKYWQSLQETTVLSGDRCIVRKAGEFFVLHGTPWSGEEIDGVDGSAPLEAVFLIEKSRDCRLLRTSPVEAVTRLYQCVFPPVWDKSGIQNTLGFLGDMVNTLPVYRLEFALDDTVVDRILALLSTQIGVRGE